MKKFFLLMMLALVCITIVNVIAPQTPFALEPLECTTAADFGWRNFGWNTLCIWALQADPGWNEDDGMWSWVRNQEQLKDDELKQPTDEDVYAFGEQVILTIWYPLRT